VVSLHDQRVEHLGAAAVFRADDRRAVPLHRWADDWGVYQKPGDFERMQECACTRMLGCHLVSGAGHWVQQEQPARVTELLLEFLTLAGVA
jgi:pimeloyl-ACP methyl ester carboxylesterase